MLLLLLVLLHVDGRGRLLVVVVCPWGRREGERRAVPALPCLRIFTTGTAGTTGPAFVAGMAHLAELLFHLDGRCVWSEHAVVERGGKGRLAIRGRVGLCALRRWATVWVVLHRRGRGIAWRGAGRVRAARTGFLHHDGHTALLSVGMSMLSLSGLKVRPVRRLGCAVHHWRRLVERDDPGRGRRDVAGRDEQGGARLVVLTRRQCAERRRRSGVAERHAA